MGRGDSYIDDLHIKPKFMKIWNTQFVESQRNAALPTFGVLSPDKSSAECEDSFYIMWRAWPAVILTFTFLALEKYFNGAHIGEK